MNTARVNKKGADRVRQGHLWIYRSDVIDVSAAGGAVVSVKDERGNFIGQALFSDSSQIALRFLTHLRDAPLTSHFRWPGPQGAGGVPALRPTPHCGGRRIPADDGT